MVFKGLDITRFGACICTGGKYPRESPRDEIQSLCGVSKGNTSHAFGILFVVCRKEILYTRTWSFICFHFCFFVLVFFVCLWSDWRSGASSSWRHVSCGKRSRLLRAYQPTFEGCVRVDYWSIAAKVLQSVFYVLVCLLQCCLAFVLRQVVVRLAHLSLCPVWLHFFASTRLSCFGISIAHASLRICASVSVGQGHCVSPKLYTT